MSLDDKRLSDTLTSLAKALNDASVSNAELAEKLREKNICFRIRLADNSISRCFVVEGGCVTSPTGTTAEPRITLTFDNAKTANRLLNPRKKPLDVLHAAKNFQVVWEGCDEDRVWLTEMFNAIEPLAADYGRDLGKGVRRYTSNTNGGPVFVDVKDGKIIRITPIDFDASDAKPWVIEARGKEFSPPSKATVNQHTLAWKSMVYSRDRILYPMRRVDFDPNGERNPQNRGVSGYVRISWDEALDLVASEIRRVKHDHGPGAILNGSGSHHTWGGIGYWQSARLRFFNTIGTTMVVHNPDSWEGFFWGASHHWGYTHHNGAPETYGTVEDCLKNCEMVVFWGADPEATGGVYGAHEGTIRRQWLKDLGIKCVHIDPYYNHTAAWLPGKWLAPRPGTDNALILAIAYVWIKEKLYDAEYVATRTKGFETWRAYLLGEEDGIAKSPEWQEAETGIPARDVRALAREWGTHRTYLAPGGIAGFGGASRTATGADWARGMVCLMAMQGLGKPGVNIGCLQQGTPVNSRFFFPGYAEGGMSGDLAGTAMVANLFQRMPQLPTTNTVKQGVPRLKIPEAVINGECDGVLSDPKTIEGQFSHFRYPAPGHSRVKLYYKYGGSHFGTMTSTNRFAEMYRSNELECVVNQSIWMEGEAKFADVILPACTNFERWDISEFANSGGYLLHSFNQCNSRVIVLQHKCIEPLGESKSDFQIFLDLSKRLGLGWVFSEGSSELGWCKRLFDATDLPDVISWKKFIKKGYYVVPPPAEEARDPVSFRWFAEGRPKDTPENTPFPGDYSQNFREGLQTQSGRLEFESSSLKRFAPDDEDRPPILKYRPAWEGPAVKELYAKYPLQLISPHPRYSFHTQSDGKDATTNEIRDHRKLVNGHYYWVMRMSQEDARARDIRDGDLVEAYNDRGSVICVVQLTQRVRPGTCHSYESAATYEPIGVPGRSPDKGGCVNILTPHRMMLKHSHSMAPNSCLIDIRKWNGQEMSR
jgi:molybdopterin guanine dinucleotide-containing S/N-oxide reductase-like protein